MLNRRRQISGLFSSSSRLRSQPGRVLSGLVLAVVSPLAADAARNREGRAGNQDRKNDDAGNNRDTSEENNRESGQRNDGKVSAESSDSSANTDKSGKRDRTESTNDNVESREQRAADGGNTRGESRRNSDSDSDSRKTSPEDDDSDLQSGRQVRRFEQRAEGEPLDEVPDPSIETPANPNVVIDDIPSSPVTDLVVEATDDVLASVSTSGGFAFARSGDVIAVSGPDGASIIQTGPAEPSDDGGNNDVGFSS